MRRDLEDYVPPIIPARYLDVTHQHAPGAGGERHQYSEEWWARSSGEAEEDARSLVRVKSSAEELAELTTPKVRPWPLYLFVGFRA